MVLPPDRRTFRRLLRDLARDRGGAAAVELALLAPFLVLLLAGLVDLSRLIVQNMQVRAAAQAGVDYAAKHGWDPTGITGAANAGAPLTLTGVTPQSLIGCLQGGAIVASGAPTCGAGGKPGRFVTVVAQAAFAPLIPGPHKLVLPATIVGQAQARVE